MGRIILPEPAATATSAAAPVVPPAEAAPLAADAEATRVASAAAETPADAQVASDAAPPAAADPSKLERAKAAAAKASADAKRHREFLARQAAANQESERLRAENAALKARTSVLDELEGLSRTDKIAAARRLGLSPREIAQAAIAEGTPEHQQKTLEDRIKADFEAKYGAKFAEQQRFIDSMTQAQQAHAIQQAESALTSKASNAETYPNLSDLPPIMVLELVRSTTRGMSPEQAAMTTHEDLLQFLEIKTAEHRKARSAASSPAASTVSPPNAAAGATQPRTQTNGATGDDKLPDDWESWSDSRQRRYMASQLDKKLAAKAPAPKTATK
jgi:hypothetical protein